MITEGFIWPSIKTNAYNTMKNKWLVAALLAGNSWAWVLAADVDPVIMRVNNKDIHKSEFEYIYNKNSQQQIDQKSLDEYVTLFKNYKLKVAEAEALGIDTTSAFKNELAGYRDELAKPYLIDTSVDEQLAREAYERMKEDVEVSHILVGLNARTPEDRAAARQKADSILGRIRAGEDFGALAEKYSEDGSRQNKGYLGFVRGGRTVYPFEKAAFALQPGEVSDVVETQFGYHLIKVHSRRPNPGEFLFAHIMVLVPRNASDEVKAQKESEIRAIYEELKAGADFATLAKERSEDTGSAVRGGELPWVSSGQFVKEFEDAGFALTNKGDITEPVLSPYGWHIIKLLDKRGIKPFEQMRSEIARMMSRDERGSMARTAMVTKLKDEYGFSLDETQKEKLMKLARELGKVDSSYIAAIHNDQSTLFSFEGHTCTVADFAGFLPKGRSVTINVADYVSAMIGFMVDKEILDYEKGRLEEKYPDFRNLMNEYRDGILLFEVSNREVWEKASLDTEGLQKYFKKNRKKYKWDKPHYKGFLIQCSDDATAQAVKKRLKKLDADSVVVVLAREFNTDSLTHVKVERGLFVEGENAMIDQLVFKGAPAKVDEKLPVAFVWGKLLKKYPEAYTDVRGQVTADYQNYLEKVWVENLNKKFPVEINEDVLKTVNKQ